ncbi:MAG: GH3 auxin-responsive promoter family protein, partial [Cyanobacteria bacterium P01_G01_bin.38]
MRGLIKGFSHLLAPAFRRFYTALTQPQQAQRAVQQRLVDRLQNCEYGRKFGINSYENWQRLPIVEYTDLEPWLSKSHAKSSPLTPEPILFYEPTSGSSGPVKQIPYTRSLRRSFNHLFCVWAYDLITQGPNFSTGKLYFSISPSFSDVTSGGTADDSDYLDPWLRWLLRPFLVMPPYSRTPAAFKENLARTLLQTEALEIISIWSPSFLTAQLDYIQTHQQRLQTDLQDRLSAARSQLLCQDNIPWPELWPQLKLISCWDSVTAADGAAGLRSQFPHVLVQGKGLLATEAPMTLPLLAAEGCVPLLDEIFFEFEDSQGRCFGLHQLEVGQVYEIIISQTGGLTRYRMGDRVRVTHHFLETPCLQFMGRGQAVSDLVGEKLHIQFVSDLLDRLALSARFQSLVPVRQPNGYVLLLDRCDRADGSICEVDAIAHQLEQGLCESFHYRLARQLGQLAPARVIVSETIAEQLSAAKSQSGQRWGDIK